MSWRHSEPQAQLFWWGDAPTHALAF